MSCLHQCPNQNRSNFPYYNGILALLSNRTLAGSARDSGAGRAPPPRKGNGTSPGICLDWRCARAVYFLRTSTGPSCKQQSAKGLDMSTMTKRDISEHISRKLGLNQQVVKHILEEFMKQVVEELADGNKLEFRDFGIFEVLNRKPRVARNPRTGERVEVPAKRRVSFRMGRLMRDRVGQAGGTGISDVNIPGMASGPPKPQSSVQGGEPVV